ncbi:MAG: hypothetical protein HYY11_10490 [Candidatus Methylomirabilis oxyfera]|nr:hypothetical protein [Candidatus Methylomirabilis oxyfera]
MLGIGRSWPIPWTLAAHVLRATRSIDEAREQLERLTRQEDQREATETAGAAWQEPDTILLPCYCTVPAIRVNSNCTVPDTAL